MHIISIGFGGHLAKIVFEDKDFKEGEFPGGPGPVLPIQEAQILVRELDPTCSN